MEIKYILIDEYFGGFSIKIPRVALLASNEPQEYIISVLREKINESLREHNFLKLLYYNKRADYYIKEEEYTINPRNIGIIRSHKNKII